MIDARQRTVGNDGRRREVDNVERQGVGAGRLRAVHPWPIAWHDLAARDTDTKAEDNGSRSRGGAQPPPNCQVPVSVRNGRPSVPPSRTHDLPSPSLLITLP